MDIDTPQVNGTSSSKRKARVSATNGVSYKEASDEDEDGHEAPSVGTTLEMFAWHTLIGTEQETTFFSKADRRGLG